MIYELRRYHTGAGRMQAMDEMCGKWVPPIFQRLGVPQAITAWHATSGPKLPAYWWLLAWPDLETRLRGWTAFYDDLEWLEVRRQFHLKSELTLQSDFYLLSEWPEFSSNVRQSFDLNAYPVQELWVQPIFLGQGKLAHTSFLQVDKPALEKAGARVIGVFDLIVGEKIPTFMIFLGWRNGASRMAGIRRYQNDRTVLACRAEEHTKVGSDVFCISDRYLFEAASLPPSGQDTSPQSLL